ncbi:MAG: YfhO family protein [Acidobacteria bacterium]|nr:YfhO family protein [Acidobacteriota bacterium]
MPDRSTAEPYKDYLIYENLNSLPRAWLVNQAKIEYEGDQLKLIRGQLNGFNPLVSAPVAHETAGKLAKPPLAEKGTAVRGKSQITRRSATNMLARIESDSASILVLSEVFVPGWKVEIDGRSSELIQVDYNLRGVQLPAGNHQVRIFYDPLSIKIGAAISFLTTLFLVFFMLRKKKDYETDEINETDEKSLKG